MLNPAYLVPDVLDSIDAAFGVLVLLAYGWFWLEVLPLLLVKFGLLTAPHPEELPERRLEQVQPGGLINPLVREIRRLEEQHLELARQLRESERELQRLLDDEARTG